MCLVKFSYSITRRLFSYNFVSVASVRFSASRRRSCSRISRVLRVSDGILLGYAQSIIEQENVTANALHSVARLTMAWAFIEAANIYSLRSSEGSGGLHTVVTTYLSSR